MPPSIGLNLRVTGYKHQGGRKYMEDDFGVAYQQTADEKDLEYAFFGIFDGHGGKEAAVFAKEHLMDFIVSQKGFWEEDDESVLKAVHEGFIQTHYAMWKELEKWPKTASGLPSTAGTTASIAFIRRGKIYIGHVGDSAIVLGVQDPDNPEVWRAEPLTTDHKPESIEEITRIQQCGGKVVCKSGVPRVVWNRPKMGHKGPVRRSTHIDEIPFLAVARSLGDLWSYNSEENVFVVSPEPDIRVYPVDINKHRCLILGTDGAWNMLTSQNAISLVCRAEQSNEQHMLNPVAGKTAWINPSKQLVDVAIDRWNAGKLRADNTSVVTVMLDPPGPPRAQVLKNRKRELAALNAGKDLGNSSLSGDRGSVALVTNTTAPAPVVVPPPQQDVAAQRSDPNHGCAIISRFPNSRNPGDSKGYNLVKQKKREEEERDSTAVTTTPSSGGTPGSFQRCSGRISDSTSVRKTSASSLPTDTSVTTASSPSRKTSPNPEDNSVLQCNEVSSSEDKSPSAASRPPSTRTSAPSSDSLPTSNSPVSEVNSEPTSSSHTGLAAARRNLLSKALNSEPGVSSPARTTRGSATRSQVKSEDNNSDIENDQSVAAKELKKAKRPVKTPVRKAAMKEKSISFVKQRCQEIENAAAAEKKSSADNAATRPVVATRPRRGEDATAATQTLRSAVKPRSLRSQPLSPVVKTPPRSMLKRKLPSAVAAASDKLPTKSPRMAVSNTKPVVTRRSKQATVLRLKKQ